MSKILEILGVTHYTCPECKFITKTAGGLTSHRRAKHRLAPRKKRPTSRWERAKVFWDNLEYSNVPKSDPPRINVTKRKGGRYHD